MRKTHNRIEYTEGQMLGNIMFIKELPEKISSIKRGTVKYRVGVFKCFCGKEFERDITSVKRQIGTARIVSCGCGKGVLSKRHGYSSRGGGKRLEYRIWCAMKARCNNPNSDRYHRYGGRGIKVCERWNKFENFIEDMKDAPSNRHSIDRINNEGNYEPSNCKWSTNTEQVNNTCRNVFIEFNGERLTLAQWARKTGIPWYRLRFRLVSGYTKEEIFFNGKFNNQKK